MINPHVSTEIWKLSVKFSKLKSIQQSTAVQDADKEHDKYFGNSTRPALERWVQS